MQLVRGLIKKNTEVLLFMQIYPTIYVVCTIFHLVQIFAKMGVKWTNLWSDDWLSSKMFLGQKVAGSEIQN